ncbi:NAD(P)H-dependent oxidoreductase [Streptomyces roseicoloratus]|uniref:NAD(P)H-dependent oxidoreductase n=1 Tax=Streptomyces roseicoloratus TaxID=2508722 RepID=UPI0013E9216E|nr:NAD(P)H-dependent oxidoreductase [Streptomyces roseicoloratus]
MTGPAVLALCASPSTTSTTQRVLDDLVTPRLSRLGLRVTPLALRPLPADALVRGDAGHPALASAAGRLEHADGVVIGTPVHKASFTGLLKVFLDLLPRNALAGKVVLPLATAHDPRHGPLLMRGLEPVLASMGAARVAPLCCLTSGDLGGTDGSGPPALDEAVDGFARMLRDPAHTTGVSYRRQMSLRHR